MHAQTRATVAFSSVKATNIGTNTTATSPSSSLIDNVTILCYFVFLSFPSFNNLDKLLSTNNHQHNNTQARPSFRMHFTLNIFLAALVYCGRSSCHRVIAAYTHAKPYSAYKLFISSGFGLNFQFVIITQPQHNSS